MKKCIMGSLEEEPFGLKEHGMQRMTPRLSQVEKCKEILVVKPMNSEPLISDETTSRVAFITGQWHGAECHPVTRVGDMATVTVNVKSLPEQAIALCSFHLSSWSQISCWYPFRPQINKVREQVPAWWEGFTLRARSPFPGSCLQSIKLDVDEAVHPKQQAPACQDRLHPFSSQPLLLHQLLTFQPLPLRFIMTCWEDLGAQHNCSENVNRRPSRHKKINRIVVKEGEKKSLYFCPVHSDARDECKRWSSGAHRGSAYTLRSALYIQ